MVGKPYDSFVSLGIHKSSGLPQGYRLEDFTILPRQVDGLDGLGLQARPDGPGLRVVGNPLAAGDHKIDVHFSVLLQGRHWSTGRKPINLTINPDPRSLWKEIEPDASHPFRRPHVRRDRVVADSVIIAASRRGRSHANKGEHRDDDFQVAHSPNRGWYAMAVADGAGSAPLSRRGAEVACNASIKALEPHLGTTLDGAFHKLVASHAAGDESVRDSINAALFAALGDGGQAAFKAVVDEAKPLGKPVEHFATTLLLTMARRYDCGWFVAAIAVGDGGVGAFRETGDVVILNKPDSGEFAGQTRFLTMPSIWADDANVRARIQFAVVQDLVALVAMTDGVSDPKFPTEQDFFDSAKWRAFWAELSAEVGLTKDNEQADSQMLEWLNFWAVGSHDDRTLAILLP